MLRQDAARDLGGGCGWCFGLRNDAIATGTSRPITTRPHAAFQPRGNGHDEWMRSGCSSVTNSGWTDLRSMATTARERPPTTKHTMAIPEKFKTTLITKPTHPTGRAIKYNRAIGRLKRPGWS